MSHINQTTANESTSEDFRGSVSEKNDDTSDYISVPANSPANSGSHATKDVDNENIQLWEMILTSQSQKRICMEVL